MEWLVGMDYGWAPFANGVVCRADHSSHCICGCASVPCVELTLV